MKEVTVWSIGNTDSTEFTHHHIEYDWVDTDYPLSMKEEFTNQAAWKNSEWKREHRMIDGNGVIQ